MGGGVGGVGVGGVLVVVGGVSGGGEVSSE